jgi:hypothetical protein
MLPWVARRRPGPWPPRDSTTLLMSDPELCALRDKLHWRPASFHLARRTMQSCWSSDNAVPADILSLRYPTQGTTAGSAGRFDGADVRVRVVDRRDDLDGLVTLPTG